MSQDMKVLVFCVIGVAVLCCGIVYRILVRLIRRSNDVGAETGILEYSNKGFQDYVKDHFFVSNHNFNLQSWMEKEQSKGSLRQEVEK